MRGTKGQRNSDDNGAQFGGGVSGRVGGKVQAVRLLAAITLEAGTPMMTKVLGLEPFAAP